MEFRKLTPEEIDFLLSRDCRADDWSAVEITDPESLQYVRNVRFSGTVRWLHHGGATGLQELQAA